MKIRERQRVSDEGVSGKDSDRMVLDDDIAAELKQVDCIQGTAWSASELCSVAGTSAYYVV